MADRRLQRVRRKHSAVDLGIWIVHLHLGELDKGLKKPLCVTEPLRKFPNPKLAACALQQKSNEKKLRAVHWTVFEGILPKHKQSVRPKPEELRNKLVPLRKRTFRMQRTSGRRRVEV